MSLPGIGKLPEADSAQLDRSCCGTKQTLESAAEPEFRLYQANCELRYLREDELPAWDALVDISPQGSPFVRSWWLQAVGGEVRILAYFKGNQLLAGIPLYFEKRFGIRLCTMPKLTQTLGPVLSPQSGRRTKDSFEEDGIFASFAKELSRYFVFFQGFHPSLQNWSPFFWNGFTQTSRATHIINLDKSEGMWRNINHGVQQNVRRAQRAGIVVATCDSDQLWQAESKTFARRNMRTPHSPEYLRRLCSSAKEHSAGECFGALDRQHNVLAAAFMIWDRNRAYCVALGADPKSYRLGAPAVLVWHLIQVAAEKTKVLDFSGSMLPGVDHFWRSFGTTQIPYSWIMKFPLWLKLYLAARRKF